MLKTHLTSVTFIYLSCLLALKPVVFGAFSGHFVPCIFLCVFLFHCLIASRSFSLFNSILAELFGLVVSRVCLGAEGRVLIGC